MLKSEPGDHYPVTHINVAADRHWKVISELSVRSARPPFWHRLRPHLDRARPPAAQAEPGSPEVGPLLDGEGAIRPAG